MKWYRKTSEFEYADYTSGQYRVRDMQYNAREWWKENGRQGYWWGLIRVNEDGTEEIIKAHFKTAKAAKEYAETI